MSRSQTDRVTGGEIGEVARDAVPNAASSIVRQTLHSASGIVILQGAALAMSFATAIVLGRLLGTEGYGRYVLALTWASALVIPAALGFDRFLVRGIAVYDVEQRWPLTRGLLQRSNQLVLLTSTLIAGAGCAAAILWLSTSLRWPFCVAMLSVPLAALTLLRQGAMQAFGRVVTAALPEFLIRPFLTLAGVAALALVGSDALTATTALGANVASVAIAFTVGAVLLRRTVPATVRWARSEYATPAWIRAALPMMLISGVWLANNYCTTLVVGTLDGARAAGVYSVAQKGAELIVVLLVAANMPLAPAIARLYARGDQRGLEHATESIARATLLVSAPIAAVFIISPELYLGIFGAGFRAGATALTILAVGQLINAAAGPSGTVLIMTGFERVAVRGVAVGLLANLLLGVVLIPPLGVTGGAIAFASSLAIWNTILVVIARRRLGVNVTAFPWLAVVKPTPGDS
jgi:O-antigen/teichoic acid export membrane protein